MVSCIHPNSEHTYVGYLLWTKNDNERLKESNAPHPLLRVKLKVREFERPIFVNALQEENNNFCQPFLPTANDFDPFPDKMISNEALKIMANAPQSKRKFRLKILKNEDMPGCKMKRHFRASSDELLEALYVKMNELLFPAQKDDPNTWRLFERNSIREEEASDEDPVEELTGEPLEEEPENPEFHQMKKELENFSVIQLQYEIVTVRLKIINKKYNVGEVLNPEIEHSLRGSGSLFVVAEQARWYYETFLEDLYENEFDGKMILEDYQAGKKIFIQKYIVNGVPQYSRVKPVIDPTYGSSDIRMPFVRKIDHLGEIKDTNVPGSSLKTVPDELEILRKKTFHYEIKQVPNILLDQVKIGLDFNLPVKDVVHQKGSPFLHLIADPNVLEKVLLRRITLLNKDVGVFMNRKLTIDWNPAIIEYFKVKKITKIYRSLVFHNKRGDFGIFYRSDGVQMYKLLKAAFKDDDKNLRKKLKTIIGFAKDQDRIRIIDYQADIDITDDPGRFLQLAQPHLACLQKFTA